MKFQPRIKSSNFPYNRHLFNPGWKFSTTHVRILVYFQKNKDGNFTSMFQMDWWQMITYVYKNLKIPLNSEIATNRMLTKSNYMKMWEKV